MLRWLLLLFIVTLLAGYFGFAGTLAIASVSAKFLFFLFVALLIVSLILDVATARGPRLHRGVWPHL